MTDPQHARLRELFDLAFELPKTARTAFLRTKCGGDDALQQRLQVMLAAADDDQFLANATAVTPPITPAGDAVPTIGEGPGSRIGPYTLLEQLGEGGFGVVFLAEQHQPVARKVALKIIKLGMDTKQVVARFEQERQALALMDHAHIARVLDAGATTTGRPYFVMDLVQGSPIVDYCDQHELSIADRLEIFAQVCAAVQHAHGKGIIHRDLKPSNVLVTTQDGRAMAKVIDFGIAKATGQGPTDRTLLTEHHQVIGTLQYMSPEQAAGSLDIDTRTDVYSLGILLYELLTGSTPFDKKTLHDAMLGEIQRMIRDVDPPRPSTRLHESRDTLARIAAHRRIEPTRLVPMLRGELDWIVMKALEKDRARRYDTANGLALDIRRYLAGDAVAAAPPSAGYRVRKLVRRHRALFAAAAAVTLALLLGIVAFAWQASVTAEQRDRAVTLQESESKARLVAEENEKKATAEARRAEAAQQEEAKARQRAETIRDFVVMALREGDAYQGGGQDVTVVDAMKNALADIEAGRFDDDPETEAALKKTVSVVFNNNGQAEEAYALATEALAIYERLHPGDHGTVASCLNDVALVLIKLGRGREAEPLMTRALAMYQRLATGDNSHVATLLNNLGDLRTDLGQPAAAEPLLRDSLAMFERLAPGDTSEKSKILDNLGSVRSAMGHADEAEALYEQALAMRRRLYPGDHPDLAVGLNNLATSRVHNGRREEAEPLFVEALEMRRRLYRGDHPTIAEALTNLAYLRNDLGRSDEAEPLIAEALAMQRRLVPGDHPRTAHMLFTLAALRMRKGPPDVAEQACIEALEMHRRLYTGDHIGVAISFANLARVQQSLKKYDDARQNFDLGVAMLRRLPNGEAPLLDILPRSASARMDAEDFAGALPEIEESIELATKHLSPTSPRLQNYRDALARCQAALAAEKGK